MNKCYCIGIIENLLLYTSDNGAAQITGGSAKRSSIEDERGCVQGELATGGRGLPERAGGRWTHLAYHRSKALIRGCGGWEKTPIK
jgi:hypothetical protein